MANIVRDGATCFRCGGAGCFVLRRMGSVTVTRNCDLCHGTGRNPFERRRGGEVYHHILSPSQRRADRDNRSLRERIVSISNG